MEPNTTPAPPEAAAAATESTSPSLPSATPFLGAIQTQIRVSSEGVLTTPRHVCVDSLEGLVNMVEGVKEGLCTLVLDSLKIRSCISSGLLGLVKVCPGVF
jgi:hypothetical protein